jgi:hypothetical protein
MPLSEKTFTLKTASGNIKTGDGGVLKPNLTLA